VTENIKTIKNIPQEIQYKEYLEIRGEVVMPISAFNMLNEKAKVEGTKVFSNPRNAAS
jgi:DNA ligase (NAD+)